MRPFPATTAVVLAVTMTVTGLQFLFPALLPALRRSPAAISSGEAWRLLTAMFVHSDGWPQIVFNFTGIAIVGVIVEQLFGARLWLVLYFLSGLIGEFAGLLWQPYGAGASVAGAGLLGGLAAWLVARNGTVQARLGGSLILLFAVALTLLRDIHGPPILAGACLSLARCLRVPTRTPAAGAPDQKD